MTVTVATIRQDFPEFASLDSTTITRWLTHAELNHNACQWGGKSDEALSFLAAHFLAAFANPCTAGKQGPGPLTGSTQGQRSVAFSPLTVPKAFTKNDLGTTKYGRRYLSMLDTLQTCRCT